MVSTARDSIYIRCTAEKQNINHHIHYDNRFILSVCCLIQFSIRLKPLQQSLKKFQTSTTIKMRTAGLIALGAMLNLTHARAVCKTDKLPSLGAHSGSEVTKSLQRTSVSESIEAICNNMQTEKFATYQSGLTVFTITRVAEASDIDDCKGQFENIIEECIAGQNAKGGTAQAGGLELGVHHDISRIPNGSRRALGLLNGLDKRLPPKPAPKAPPKAAAPRYSTKCLEKAKKGKKKTTRGVLLQLVSKVLRRSSPSSNTSSMDAAMEEVAYQCEFGAPVAAIPGWGGSTFSGYYKEMPNKPIGQTTLKNLVKEKYGETKKLVGNEPLLLAGLYIPGDGVYFGTIGHGTGEQLFRQQVQATAPRLWSQYKNRDYTKQAKEDFKKKGTPLPSLVHAEDVAMFNYEKRNPGVNIQQKYAGAAMAAYGQRLSMLPVGSTSPCSGEAARITPTCQQVLNSLDIRIWS